MSLKGLREEIDRIDIELQKLFEKRMALCDQVAVEKKATDAPVLQSGREEQILKAARERSDGFADSSEEFFKQIMAISRGRQNALMSEDLDIPDGGCVNAIIACGGSSTRMGFNKLLYPLVDVPVVLRTIKSFDGIPGVSRIIITVAQDFKREVEDIIKAEDFTSDIVIVSGSQTRQESVANASAALSDDCDWICIHDGARPLISRDVITKCIEDARETGAAVVCVPVKDTIKEVEYGYAVSTPDRDTLFAAQTPQIISRELYFKALKRARDTAITYTDDVSMCEALGIKPKITLGEYTNIKLTTEEDIETARRFIEKETE